MKIPFVRILKTIQMERGFAVDKAGKRWRGFYAHDSEEKIRQTGMLGDVGLCFCCHARIWQGWECMDDRKDVCDNCVQRPKPEMVFEFEPANEEAWELLKREFFDANFDHKVRKK